MKRLFVLSFIFSFLPFFLEDSYIVQFLIYLFMWCALSSFWNIFSGYTGYIDFGAVAYFGIGAYTMAMAMNFYKINIFLGILLCGFVSIVLSYVFGWITLRIKGSYFAIATFSLAEGIREIITFSGGSQGITLPVCENWRLFYYLMLFFAFMGVFILNFFEKSEFGKSLKAISESEESAEMIGIDTFSTKLKAYIISAVLIGSVGGVYSYWITYIVPSDVFSVHKTVQMVVMTLIGGMGSVWGPVIGATFLTGISEILGVEMVEDYLIVVGLVIILVVVLSSNKRWRQFLKLKA